MKAFWIRTALRVVEAVEYNGLHDLNRMVEGSIELAGLTPRRDTVYVNEEGLYTFTVYFEMPGVGQGVFAGPGVIVGSEIGHTTRTRDPRITLEEVTSKVRFLSHTEAMYLKELGL